MAWTIILMTMRFPALLAASLLLIRSHAATFEVKAGASAAAINRAMETGAIIEASSDATGFDAAEPTQWDKFQDAGTVTSTTA